MTIGPSSLWSSQTPNVMITTSGSQILSYNTSTNTWTTIKDFAGTPGWATGDYIWQMSRSMDDNTFAFRRDLSALRNGFASRRIGGRASDAGIPLVGRSLARVRAWKDSFRRLRGRGRCNCERREGSRRQKYIG